MCWFVSPNKKSQTLRVILSFVLVCQIGLAVAKGYYQGHLEGASEFLAGCFLYFAVTSLNYCNCVVYVFLCTVNVGAVAISIGTKYQDGIDFTDFSEQQQRLFIIISSVSFAFYIIAGYFAFQAYREFKGIAFDILVATHTHELSAIEQYSSGKQLQSSSNIHFTPLAQNSTSYNQAK